MSDLLRLVANHNNGVFTAAQAALAGFDGNRLKGLVTAGTCVRLRQGLYVLADSMPIHSSERHRLVALGVSAKYDGRIALSHHSAAVLHELPTWGVPHQLVRGVRIEGRHTTSTPGTSIGKPWPDDAYVRVDGHWALTPAVCCLQIAMASGVEEAVVSLDAALSRGLTSARELEGWVVRLGGHRNVTRARRAVELSNGLSESPGESRLRVRLHQLGYTELELQVPFRTRDGRFLGRVDLFDRTRLVVVEFDGRVKYDGPDGTRALFREKRREDSFREYGVGFARYAWEDLDHSQVLVERFERAAAVATQVSRARA